MVLVLPLQAGGDFIKLYWDAVQLEKTDPAEAAAQLEKSYEMALAAGNVDYASSAGGKLCFMIYRRGDVIGAGDFAQRMLTELEPFPSAGPHNDALRRVQVLGFVERKFYRQGKIGEAWRMNRLAAETLRGKRVELGGDGQSITADDLTAVPKELRASVWRTIEREAEFLDLTGRTVDARVLLEKAIHNGLGDADEVEKFYHFKVASTHAKLTDFLGYEEEALLAQKGLMVDPPRLSVGQSSLVLHLNYLRNLSQWEGPSEEILIRARGLNEQLRRFNPPNQGDRLLAKMELHLRDSEAARESLAEGAALDAAIGHELDSLYSSRDSLIERSRIGEEALDDEFIRLLHRSRGQGNKRAEPSLYREYGSYLFDRGRSGEAVGMYAEALRLSQSFGWHLHEPGLLLCLFHASQRNGDHAGARMFFGELEAWIERYPEAPLARRVNAHAYRAMALGRLGEREAALAALRQLREMASPLPAYKTSMLNERNEAAFIGKPFVSDAAVAVRLNVQPLEVMSVAAPGDGAATVFTVFNSGPAGVIGEWRIKGPGASITGASVSFLAGAETTSLSLPSRVSAGGRAKLGAAIAAGNATQAEVEISWKSEGADESRASTWSITWDESAGARVVLDASGLEGNPFRSIPLFHEIAVPPGEDLAVPFRLRSPLPLRFEYYDPNSGSLLAIDANGNGDFSDEGDFHLSGIPGLMAAMLPVRDAGKTISVEVNISPAPGHAPPTADAPLILEVEVFRDGGWVKEAENIMR